MLASSCSLAQFGLKWDPGDKSSQQLDCTDSFCLCVEVKALAGLYLCRAQFQAWPFSGRVCGFRSAVVIEQRHNSPPGHFTDLTLYGRAKERRKTHHSVLLPRALTDLSFPGKASRCIPCFPLLLKRRKEKLCLGVAGKKKKKVV